MLSPLSAAATEAVIEVLAAADEPLSTRQVEEATGYGHRHGHGTLAYRMLYRLAARGEAERIIDRDKLCVYWKLAAAGAETPQAAPPGPHDTRTVTIRIRGERQVRTFDAMCARAGRAPCELAYDLVLDAIRDGQADHETQHLAALAGEATLIHGGPRSAAGRREMLRLLDPDAA